MSLMYVQDFSLAAMLSGDVCGVNPVTFDFGFC